MILIRIAEWTGNNYGEIVSKIVEVNPEVKIQILKSKIILRDDEFSFNRAVLIGDFIKVPLRENIEEDEFENNDEAVDHET